MYILFYLRHPLPDYYNMILEVHPNRSTNATVVICDSKNPAVPQCPKSYSDGQKYIKRSTNNVCPKLQVKITCLLLISHVLLLISIL